MTRPPRHTLTADWRVVRRVQTTLAARAPRKEEHRKTCPARQVKPPWGLPHLAARQQRHLEPEAIIADRIRTIRIQRAAGPLPRPHYLSLPSDPSSTSLGDPRPVVTTPALSKRPSPAPASPARTLVKNAGRGSAPVASWLLRPSPVRLAQSPSRLVSRSAPQQDPRRLSSPSAATPSLDSFAGTEHRLVLFAVLLRAPPPLLRARRGAVLVVPRGAGRARSDVRPTRPAPER